MSRFSKEFVVEIWDDDNGSRVELGPDRDGLDLLEIRERGPRNDILARITLTEHQAKLLSDGIKTLLKIRQEEKENASTTP